MDREMARMRFLLLPSLCMISFRIRIWGGRDRGSVQLARRLARPVGLAEGPGDLAAKLRKTCRQHAAPRDNNIIAPWCPQRAALQADRLFEAAADPVTRHGV